VPQLGLEAAERPHENGTPASIARHRDIPVCKITVGSRLMRASVARTSAPSSCDSLAIGTYNAGGLLNLS
jgi:hypothetical protein